MSVRSDLRSLFRQSFLGHVPAHQLEAVLDGGVLTIDPRVRGSTAQAADAFRYRTGPSYYLVGCLSLCRITGGYASFLMENGGELGFTSGTSVTGCRTAADIREAVVAIGRFTSGFRHPLNLPPDIYRIVDIDAAFSAAAAYRSEASDA